MDERDWDNTVDTLEQYWRKQTVEDRRVARACPQLDELLRAALPVEVMRRLSRLSAAQRTVVRNRLRTLAERDAAVRALVRAIAGPQLPAEPTTREPLRVVTHGDHVEVIVQREIKPKEQVGQYDTITLRLHSNGPSAYGLDFTATSPDDDVSIHATPQQHAAVVLELTHLLDNMLDDAAYGEYLTKQVFADPRVLRVFGESFAGAQRAQRPLCLRIDVSPDAAELHGIHWEKLRHPAQGSPLSARDDIWFSRGITSDVRLPAVNAVGRSEHLLVAIASPTDLSHYQLSPIDGASELAHVQAAIPAQSRISVTALPRVTQRALLDGLRSGPTILYLICHGIIRDERLWIFLEDEKGTSAKTPADDVVTQIKGLVKRPLLAILGACESAGTGIHTPHRQLEVQRTLGIQLVEAGIPAVIAMQGPISAETMRVFGSRVLKELGSPALIDRAVAIARSQVAERPDWWVPCLLLRR